MSRLSQPDGPQPSHFAARLRNYFLTGLVVAGPIATTTRTGGNVIIQNDGLAGLADKSVRVGLFGVAEVGNATVTSNNVAGNVFASAGQSSTTQVSGNELPFAAAGTLITSRSKNVYGAGKATVVIGVAGDVLSVTALGATGGADVTINGKTTGNVNATAKAGIAVSAAGRVRRAGAGVAGAGGEEAEARQCYRQSDDPARGGGATTTRGP